MWRTVEKHRLDIIGLSRRCIRSPNPTNMPSPNSLIWSLKPRDFIDSVDTVKEDRPRKILDAYPCFKDLKHVSP